MILYPNFKIVLQINEEMTKNNLRQIRENQHFGSYLPKFCLHKLGKKLNFWRVKKKRRDGKRNIQKL
jgi:hypothetical protein